MADDMRLIKAPPAALVQSLAVHKRLFPTMSPCSSQEWHRWLESTDQFIELPIKDFLDEAEEDKTDKPAPVSGTAT
jgi:hypothetical protein